jgi:hypothetical protein
MLHVFRSECLHMFHTYVATTCFTHIFQMFHLFLMYIASVLSGCCIYLWWICCKCMFQMFHLFQMYVTIVLSECCKSRLQCRVVERGRERQCRSHRGSAPPEDAPGHVRVGARSSSLYDMLPPLASPETLEHKLVAQREEMQNLAIQLAASHVAGDAGVARLSPLQSGTTDALLRRGQGAVERRTDVLGTSVRMAADRVRGEYPRVSGPTGSGLGMISHPRFSGSISGLVSGSVSGLVFHPWISNGYPK